MDTQTDIKQIVAEVPAVQKNNDLKAICKELKVKDIKYLPSPKNKSVNMVELAKRAHAMLRIYQRHVEGDTTAPIRMVELD